MVAIINGARVTPPKPDIRITNVDANDKLIVVNDAKLITEPEKGSPSAQRKIADFTPDKLKKSSAIARLQQVIIKQRKGENTEVTIRIKKKVAEFKQQQLKDSRFAGEVGKGSISDVLA
ncbi:MAG TPA: hypothetical protein QF468_04930 [Nitrospinota bacterium]|jgi:hypothetical protein|nr:hypothetical protein [Nitrospinota bacterium]